MDILICFYIAFPVLVFFLGWMKWFIAVPAALIVLWSFIRGARRAKLPPAPEKKNLLPVILIAVIGCVWVYLSGVGGFVYQNGDHYWRNEQFRLLVEREWPVKSVFPAEDGTPQLRYMSYYIGFWMPAALFGKIFGLSAGYAFQAVWAALGVFLVAYKIAEHFGKWSVWMMLLFIFFSGLDVISQMKSGMDLFDITYEEHIEWWNSWQLSSHTTQLFWVFNQAIYGWLLTMMILNDRNNGRMVLLWGCGLIFCTFPFVGMIPYIIYRMIRNNGGAGKGKAWRTALIRSVCTPENVLGGGVTGILSFLYLSGNPNSSDIGLYPFSKPMLFFVFMEAGVYAVAIFKYQYKNPLLYIAMAVLMICPMVRVSDGADFCMRVSIPSLVVLCLLVTETLRTTFRKKDRVFSILILLVFLIGCVTPFCEINRTVQETIRYRAEGKPFLRYFSEDEIMNSPTFSAPAEGNIFGDYILK